MERSFILILISLSCIECYGQNQISGVWYGVEKIPHTKGEYKIEHTRECFHIDIREVYTEPTPPTSYLPTTNSPYVNRAYGLPERYRIRHFILEWNEGLWREEYHIKVNTSHKGFWPTDVPNGSVEKMYRFFGGVIQVLKVAKNHLVLNFCMRLPHSQLYSVVLARNENQLTPEDLANIHNVFTMKRLSTSALKRVCENSAVNLKLSGTLFLIVSFLILRYCYCL
ncbi:unnamed protein product [Parnassius mnemosyne]|uniref:Uncharacterized protein n=1 Tax=Parnassius mnemosyne TaxID=213953 RepID=A0AAV1LX07_9NEOP